jgi:orotidine-5'-phosphate decarboxylase
MRAHEELSEETISAAAAEERLAVALDFPSAAEALALVDRLDGTCRWFKVGMELYYAAGNGLIETLRGRGFEVFLDLKLHDIPNTVAGAVRSVAGTGASLLTIHAGGGGAMMRAAAEATGGSNLRLLAVTVLTSMDSAELAGVGVEAAPAEQVLRLGRLAWASGIGGMVCSAEEVGALRSDLGAEVMLVTPGIRAAGEAVGDQRRVATAAEAIARGASMLVVGRPITRAGDPGAAARGILEEIRRATPSPPFFCAKY